MGKISVKFMLGTVIVVVVGISVLGWIMTRSLESEVRGRADQEEQDQVESMLTVLQTVDNLSSESVRSAMKVLLQEGERIGVPETGAVDEPRGTIGSRPPFGKLLTSREFCSGRSPQAAHRMHRHSFCEEGRPIRSRLDQRSQSGWLPRHRDDPRSGRESIRGDPEWATLLWRGGHSGQALHDRLRTDAECSEADDRHLVRGLPFDRGRRSWPAHQQRQNSGPRIRRAPPRRRKSDIQAANR